MDLGLIQFKAASCVDASFKFRVTSIIWPSFVAACSFFSFSVSLVPADYGKRVYQGVRVKHTVKDLLAEKRSRQTSGSRFNGSAATTQSSFLPLSGSPAVSGYYGVRRSLMTDVDLQSSKQIPSDVYAPSLLAKPFPYESHGVQGYPSLLDTYFSDQYGDHRLTPVTSGTASLFGTSPVPPVIPSFPSDSAAHFLSVSTNEQVLPDSLSQPEVCSNSLQASSAPGCLSSPEPGGPSQYRNPSWNSPLAGPQPYSLHALEDVQYTSGYSAASPYPFSSFPTVANDLTPKALHGSPEESADNTSPHDSSPLWPKEDGNPLWGAYECRRTY
ncbi:POU domain class 2-associating factor 2 [Heteronotia binoei]|uniref:POU domain class 2-associating factor 2 n=1 Tax=Heteronotia binoei TaxID=13085 RepID=UPI00292FC23B|nr:POU domain class 2-associating factor 2 [Heteronotia binoei]